MSPSSAPSNPGHFQESAQFAAIREKLEQHHLAGAELPLPAPTPEPLDRLIRRLVGQQTSAPLARRQMEALQTAYSSWEEALLAGPDDLEDTLRRAGGGLSAQKARAIYGLLETLAAAQTGERLSLRFLYRLSDEEVRAQLLALRGVGELTTSLLMLFDMGRPALPVERNIARVCVRCEFVPPDWSLAQVTRWLNQAVEPHWSARYRFHVAFIRHGRQLCKARLPVCHACPVHSLCPSAVPISLGQAQL